MTGSDLYIFVAQVQLHQVGVLVGSSCSLCNHMVHEVGIQYVLVVSLVIAGKNVLFSQYWSSWLVFQFTAYKLQNTRHATLDKFVPYRTKIVARRPLQPLYNDNLHEAKCRRRQAERTWRSTDLEVHHQIHCHEMTT